MKLTFNAPFTIYFAILALVIFLITGQTNGFNNVFVLQGIMEPTEWQWYLGLIGYPLAHANFQHFLGNFSIILLLGPILENKYGWKRLLTFSLISCLLTAILHIAFWDIGLIGASGIAFMFIILSSLIHIKANEIPITFILVTLLYLGQEVLATFQDDKISHFAHIMGGLTGIYFGYFWKRA
ncbi:MAG: rhomboid family intramembrane serine protease [Cryomorphaceae bacterium]|nr:rhomboid family intramembrane serine protease [Cryomorphaceae bacterium]